MNWKGGISKDKEHIKKIKKIGGKKYRETHKEYYREFLKKWRHKKGISEKYNTGISYTKEYKKLYRKQYKYSFRNAGKLSTKIIQLVYEDNIKRYGTLTCYLCRKFIDFGKDSLEHKTPLSRGGD